MMREIGTMDMDKVCAVIADIRKIRMSSVRQEQLDDIILMSLLADEDSRPEEPICTFQYGADSRMRIALKNAEYPRIQQTEQSLYIGDSNSAIVLSAYKGSQNIFLSVYDQRLARSLPSAQSHEDIYPQGMVYQDRLVFKPDRIRLETESFIRKYFEEHLGETS